jgi:Plasmid pRiA4b ORF-3-like protein
MMVSSHRRNTLAAELTSPHPLAGVVPMQHHRRMPEGVPARCVGGRRAAPPDDCGGIWGYQELIEVLADPAHPEHEERLEWLGLTDATQFTPDSFDLARVNERLRGH